MSQEVCYFSKQYNNQETISETSNANRAISPEYFKRQKYLLRYRYFNSIEDLKSVEKLFKQRKAIAEDIRKYENTYGGETYDIEPLYELLDYINDLIREALGL